MKSKLINIGYHYCDDSWMVPNDIFGQKNTGIRLRVSPTVNGNHRWFKYYDGCRSQRSDSITLIDNKRREHHLSIDTNNLIEILSTHDSYPGGLVEGTFMLSKRPYSVDSWRLIPDNSKEGLVKRELTDKYYSPSLKWSKKVIPGHLYLSKSGDLLLALTGNVDLYLETSTFLYGFGYSCIRKFSSTPIKVKNMVFIHSCSLDDVIRSEKTSNIDSKFYTKLYSDRYLLKDLGKLLEDDDWMLNIIRTPMNKIELPNLFLGPIFERPETKDYLRELIKSERSKMINSPGLSSLCNELGI